MRMGMRAAVLIALLLLLVSSTAGVASAQFPEPVNCVINSQTTDMGTCLANALPLAMIGILVSLGLIALVYMLGEVVQISSLKNWYKNELKETAKSLMIIAIAMASLVILSSIAASLIGYGSISTLSSSGISSNIGYLYTAAETYLTTQQNVANNALNYLTGVALGINLLKSTTLSLWVPIPVVPVFVPPFFPCIVCFQFGSYENIYQSSVMDSQSPGVAKNLAYIKDAIDLLAVPMILVTTAQVDLLPCC